MKMTRINLIPVSELKNRHLIAEYREITMIPAAVRRIQKSKRGLDKNRIPSKYTLNKGHVLFFIDKGRFLANRYTQLVNEMVNRGFKPDSNRRFPLEDFPVGYDNDWTPTVDEIEINRERINLRIAQKPHLYND